MQVNLTAFLLLALVGVAALVIHGRGRSWSSVRDLLGLRTGPASVYLWLIPYTIGAVIVLAAIARFVVPETFSHPPSYTTLYVYGQQRLGVGSLAAALVYEVLMTALGEELFFRGLVAGWLLGWLGARWGNLAQSAVFLVPHLPVILIAPGLWWLVLIAALGGGLLLGLIRARTGSILPGLLGHGIGNTVAAGVTMWVAHS